MAKQQIDSVVRNLAEDIPGSHSYIYDRADKQFIYVSEDSGEVERSVLHLDEKYDLPEMVESAIDNILTETCDLTGRIILVKRMANDLYFGLSVISSPEFKLKARSVMKSTFQIEA